MRKIINPCTTKDGIVYCEITFADGKLSIHGVIGPMSNGDSRGGCGQINISFRECYPDPTFIEGWTAELFARFLSTWDRWHLNDMRAGCQHQREAWDIAVEDATATPEEYAAYQTMKARVYAVTMGFDAPKYETLEIAELLSFDMVKVEKTEEKAAGWVSHLEHPEGLLSKPCPVCRYKYGSTWLKESVPDDVIAFLESLPESTKTPAWV
jgi:hypothetical protein